MHAATLAFTETNRNGLRAVLLPEAKVDGLSRGPRRPWQGCMSSFGPSYAVC